MISAVVIELPQADDPSANARAMLEACDVAMNSRGRCVVGRESAPNRKGVAVVLFTWDGPARGEAYLDAEVAGPSGSVRRSRTLRFAPNDPEVERWRTAGFAIATLVGEVLASAGQAPAATLSEDEHDDHHGAVAQTGWPSAFQGSGADAVAQSWLDARFVLTRGAPALDPAIGAEVRFSRLLDRGPLFLTGALRCTFQSAHPDSLSIVRPSAAAGVGVLVLTGSRGFQATLHVEAFLEVVEATATDPETGLSSNGSRWLAGAAEGAEGGWMWSSKFGMFLGAEMREAASATVRSRGQPVAQLPSIDIGAQAGLRFGFP
ncbi:MAG: hypothetical protein M3O50_12615 [Myxococcota bacterium]|nr:hypothetical protein [Myxococcota bacterium]